MFYVVPSSEAFDRPREGQSLAMSQADNQERREGWKDKCAFAFHYLGPLYILAALLNPLYHHMKTFIYRGNLNIV